jgi:hypothetical protein
MKPNGRSLPFLGRTSFTFGTVSANATGLPCLSSTICTSLSTMMFLRSALHGIEELHAIEPQRRDVVGVAALDGVGYVEEALPVARTRQVDALDANARVALHARVRALLEARQIFRWRAKVIVVVWLRPVRLGRRDGFGRHGPRDSYRFRGSARWCST